MKKTFAFMTACLLLACALPCAAETRYRNGQGRTQGTSTQNGSQTVYRDATGRTVGTATPNGSQTVYRDGSGRTLGTSSTNGSNGGTATTPFFFYNNGRK